MIRLLRSAYTLALAGSLVAHVAAAQISIAPHVRQFAAAGSELENYLRVLQDAGLVRPYPWSVRAFGPVEQTTLVPANTDHPWSDRLRPGVPTVGFFVLAPAATTQYNSAYPYGINDGPVWAGRGVTTDFQLGIAARVGPLSVLAQPEIFRAQNAAFPLQPNGQAGPLAFDNAYAAGVIDDPQRFGAAPYSRLDAGQSQVRLDLWPLALGFSNANEYWGPAVEQPIILGNNAAGFPHAFVGTSHPVNLWVGTLQARAIWGRLDQSNYSPVQTGERRRFATGAVAVLGIRGLPGLELGASRFYHEVWPVGGPTGSDFTLPFTLHNFAASRQNLAGLDATNQLASVFARWVFPSAGLELYGEFGRDDYNTDIYDLLSEPDHSSAYSVGFQRVWRVRGQRLVALRGEVLNSRVTDLANVRGEAPFYVHSPVVQGHTQLGQVLGAAGGLGGGAASLAADIYSPRGKWSVEWSRLLLGNSDPSHAAEADVLHALTFSGTRFFRYFDLRASAAAAVELNRAPRTDVGNLNLQLGARLHW